MFEQLFTTQALLTLVTLTFLEIILGIDNIVLISVMTDRLPKSKRQSARKFGILVAVVTRLMLLGSIAWLASLTAPLFELFSHPFSVRDTVLFVGGLFLIYKAGYELTDNVFLSHRRSSASKAKKGGQLLWVVMAQISLIDIVFSLDSVITAVGIADSVAVMVLAILISVAVMLLLVNPICNFIERYPSIKRLALAFLLAVGALLCIESMGFAVPHSYLYVTFGFALFVESMNIMAHRQAQLSSRRSK